GCHAALETDRTIGPSHLNYIDHNTGMKVHADSISSYEVLSPTCRQFSGPCQINGQPGTFTVQVCDNGEPGRNDTFSISLSTGYSAGGTLAGGNIQLHAPCAGKP